MASTARTFACCALFIGAGLSPALARAQPKIASRMLFVRIDTRRKSARDLMASAGHELQHALEVLVERGLRSTAAIQLFFMRGMSPESPRAVETAAAVAAGKCRVSGNGSSFVHRRQHAQRVVERHQIMPWLVGDDELKGQHHLHPAASAFKYWRFRAWSTSTRRMRRAAIDKECVRSCN